MKCECCGRPITFQSFCRECGSNYHLIKKSMECLDDKMAMRSIGLGMILFFGAMFFSALNYIEGHGELLGFITSACMSYVFTIPWRICYRRFRINEEKKFVMVLAGPDNG